MNILINCLFLQRNCNTDKNDQTIVDFNGMAGLYMPNGILRKRR